MKKKYSDIIWGLSLIFISIILLGNLLGFWFIDLFSSWCWTLFIIIPAILGLFINKFKTINIILVIIGVFSIIWYCGFISWYHALEILLSLVVFIIGIKLVISGFMGSKNHLIKVMKREVIIFNGIFGSFYEKCTKSDFKGAKISSIVGSVSLDLSDIKIKDDIKINAICILGKIKLKVNDNVNVEISGTNIFSSINNGVSKNSKKLPTIYIDSTCIFGNIKIK